MTVALSFFNASGIDLINSNFLLALTKPMDKRFWSFFPETLRTIDNNNDECINGLYLI